MASNPSPAEPLRIAIRQFTDFEDSLASQLRAFCAATGEPQPIVTTYDLHGLQDALFAENGLLSGSCDLALFSTDWIGQARAAHLLADLSPYLSPKFAQPSDWPRAWPNSLTQACMYEGRTDCIPWHDGPEALLYRSDLFADPAEQAAYQAAYGEPLVPPRTWDQFLQVARFFTRPAQQQYGTLVAAYPDGHNTLYDLTLQLWSRGGDWTDGVSSQLTLQTPAMEAALTFYRELVTDPGLCHPRSPQLASTETGDVFLAGEVVMMVNWFGFAARCERTGSPLQGKVALAPIPSDSGTRTLSLSAFWVFGMAQGSQRKQRSAALLRFLMQPDTDLLLLPHGAVPVRLSTWRNPEVHAVSPPFRRLEELSSGARALPQSPQLPRLADLADHLTQQAITTTTPIGQILAEARVLYADLRL